MTARIDLARGVEGTCVKVAGRLDESSSRQLLDVCRRHEGELLIDLEELISLDEASIETLRGLRAAGARLLGTSPYIALLLNGRADELTDLKKEDE